MLSCRPWLLDITPTHRERECGERAADDRRNCLSAKRNDARAIVGAFAGRYILA